MSSGAVCGLVVIGFVLVLPLAMMKWLAGAVAPAVTQSVSNQLHSYLAGPSELLYRGLTMAVEGLALLAAVLYLAYLLGPIGLSTLSRARRSRSAKGSKYYVKLGRKAAATIAPLRRVPAK